MPTYQNTQNETIWATDAFGNSVEFEPGQTKITDLILTSPNNQITKLFDTPYYEPVGQADTMTMGTSGTSATFVPTLTSRGIRIVLFSGGPVEMYINSLVNIPIMIVESVTIKNEGRVEELYFTNKASGKTVLDVKEILEGGGYIPPGLPVNW